LLGTAVEVGCTQLTGAQAIAKRAAHSLMVDECWRAPADSINTNLASTRITFLFAAQLERATVGRRNAGLSTFPFSFGAPILLAVALLVLGPALMQVKMTARRQRSSKSARVKVSKWSASIGQSSK
jgi:hypothetical protein